MKTFDRKDVYSVLNAEDASQYVGEKGYFANTLSALKDKVYKNILSTLDDVNQLNDYPFITDTEECYLFFLLEDKVKEIEEKKWRPFTLEEFLNKFSIGLKISYRNKNKKFSAYMLFVGYFESEVTREPIIMIGLTGYSLDDFFKKYEYLDEHGEWQPFGVKE